MNLGRTQSSQLSRSIGGLIIISSLLVIAVTVLAFIESGAGADTRTSTTVEGPVDDTLITGRVTDADGPVVGTRVQVAVWPEDDDAEIGEAVDLLELEPVRTDDEGRYVVVLPLEDVPAKYLMQERIVNFEVRLVDARVLPLSTPAEYPRGAAWWVDSYDRPHDDPKSLDFDLESMKATEKSSSDTQFWPLTRW